MQTVVVVDRQKSTLDRNAVLITSSDETLCEVRSNLFLIITILNICVDVSTKIYCYCDEYTYVIVLLLNTERSTNISGIPAEPSCNAVSYTHLDVYKRQT